MKKQLFLFSLLVIGAVTTSCASENATQDPAASAPETAAETAAAGDAMPEMEGMEADTGNVEMTLVGDADTVPMGEAQLVVAVKDTATGEPVTTENLKVYIYMPMEGMDDMKTEAEVSASDEPGTYTVDTYLGMAGTWVMNTALEDGEQAGKAHLMFEVQ